MIETVVQVNLLADEVLRIQKNRLHPDQMGTAVKRFCLCTGIHGDELEGQYVAFLVAQRIKEHREYLQGIVDIYPGMNPLGIDSITRGIPAFDLDMNRLFPGNTDGDMNEFIASRIVADMEGADLIMDIHASNIYLTEVPQIRINEITCERLMPFALRANVDFIWVHSNSTVLESTFAYSMNSRNVPTLVVEMGVGMRLTKAYCEQLTDGIFVLLKDLGIWTGPTIEPRKPIVSAGYDDVEFLNASVSGIFVKTQEHGAML